MKPSCRGPKGRTPLGVVAVVLALARVASGQELASSIGEGLIQYLSGRAAGNGYVTAQVPVRYQFRSCFGTIVLMYQVDSKRLSVSGEYALDGRVQSLDRSTPPPNISSAPLAAAVAHYDRPGAILLEVSDQYAITDQGFGCYGQTKKIGEVKTLVGANVTEPQVTAYLNRLHLVMRRAPTALRNQALENTLNNRARAAADTARRTRQDSINQAGQAQQRARADSIARMRVADSVMRARGLGAPGGAGATATAGGAGGVSGTAAGSAGATRSGAQSNPNPERSAADSAARVRQAEQDARTLSATIQLRQAAENNFRRAESYYVANNHGAARPLYQELVNNYYASDFIKEQSRRRLNAMVQDQGVAVASQGIAGISTATGLAMGFTASATYFETDVLIGVTGARMLGKYMTYGDFALGGAVIGPVFENESADDFVPSGERVQLGIRVGTTPPWKGLKLSSGFLVPHGGLSFQKTDHRLLKLLHYGVMWRTRHDDGFVRFDITKVNGENRFGGALAILFGEDKRR